MNPLIIWSEPGVEIIWKVISFFASEPEQQAAMIGPTKDWFLEENMRENSGANYLLGMAFAYNEYRGPLCDLVTSIAYEEYTGFVYDPDDDSHIMILEDINNQLEKMKEKKKYWSVYALAEDEDWRHLRELSQKALASYGFDLNPPSEPFWFPDIFHIDEWGDPEGKVKEKKD